MAVTHQKLKSREEDKPWNEPALHFPEAQLPSPPQPGGLGLSASRTKQIHTGVTVGLVSFRCFKAWCPVWVAPTLAFPRVDPFPWAFPRPSDLHPLTLWPGDPQEGVPYPPSSLRWGSSWNNWDKQDFSLLLYPFPMPPIDHLVKMDIFFSWLYKISRLYLLPALVTSLGNCSMQYIIFNSYMRCCHLTIP